ncbi:transglycosylase SLT domain-containing protein [bacterium]|nr:transglycosylase SLT domain-containing protein [candidate division CSSED10-310 bacterium]
MIGKKVRERCLPEAVIWIPMVETWFQNESYSRNHAVGLWQLIPATARNFGLRIDEWVDERLDPEQSTDTALQVLDYLHDKLGDWLLALAAYNAGEGCVNRAIDQTGSRDYWVLARQRALPSQTRFYVAAVLALAEIGRDPAKHDVNFPPNAPVIMDRVPVGPQISLRQIAALSGITLQELRRLNPSLKRSWTPTGNEPFNLCIPAGSREPVLSALNEPDSFSSGDLVVHIIQPGDTLSDLAHAYQSTIDAIMAVNQLKHHIIIAGREILIPAGLNWN